MAKQPISISNKPLTIEDLRLFLAQNQQISLSEVSKKKIARNRKFLDKKVAQPGARYYGINTGFGALCDVEISADQLEQLQENLVMSHACGMGEEVKPEVVKLMLLLKVKGLSQGHSGVAVDTVEKLVELV
jgi:histidine ammonia-lyase